MDVVFYLHLVGATVWVGGLVVMAGLIPAVRNATPDRAVLRAVARRFGVISWAALALLVVTGTIMVLDRPWTGALTVKLGLVLVSALLAGWHTVAAADQTPAVRGAIQGTILVLALVILAVATIV